MPASLDTLPPSARHILKTLDGPMHVDELASETGYHPNTVRIRCRELTRKGLVESCWDTADSRKRVYESKT